MRKALLSALAVAMFATSAMAQGFDLFYVMPGDAGSKGIDAGISASDVGSIADVSVVNLMGKYSVSDQIEVGALAELGVLIDGADALSTLTVGAKYAMSEDMALTASVLAIESVSEEIGVEVGVMKTITSGDMMINNALEIGLLDGYTGGVGFNVNLLVEPTMAINDKITGYLDLLVSTNTDDISGTPLAIDLGPNVDIMVTDSGVVNVGVIVGLAGDSKAADLGFGATFVMGF